MRSENEAKAVSGNPHATPPGLLTADALPPARPNTLRTRLVGLALFLLAANLAAWACALWAFAGQPALLGTALLAYALGLRHAVDADHIAAIDNATRKLVGDGGQPVGVGLFFALGHSCVVLLAAAGTAFAASSFADAVAAWKDAGELVATCVSALFLFAIGAANLVALRPAWRAWRRARRAEAPTMEDLTAWPAAACSPGCSAPCSAL